MTILRNLKSGFCLLIPDFRLLFLVLFRDCHADINCRKEHEDVRLNE